MELIEGFTLLQLLRFLNVSLETIILPCNFCFTVLGILDKASFAASKLKVVVRDKCYKGACISCRRALAAAEKKKYLVCLGEGDLVEAMCGTGIVHCTIRCVECLALLSASEKLVAKANLRTFYLVRHMWRTQCRNCAPPGC